MLRQPETALDETVLSVLGMMCEGCADKVRDVLLALPGVRVAKPNAWRKRVTVQFASSLVDVGQMTSALAVAGFDAVEARP